jgi:hypothetical protein
MLNKERIIEEKIYRRRRKKRKRRRQSYRISSPGMFKGLSFKVQPELSVFLRNHGFFKDSYVSTSIKAPADFSFEDANDESIVFFKKVLSTFYLSDNVLVMDFSDCRDIAIPNAMLLNLIIIDFKAAEREFNRVYFSKIHKRIRIIQSRHLKANKCLHVFDLLDNVDVNDGDAYLYLGNQVGFVPKSLYRYNVKGAICTKVREFVNESLKASNAMLNKTGENKLDGLLSEIFNNAEDHSTFKKWFVNGVSYREIAEKEETIVELNLGILNFGYSISEGLFNNYDRNKEMMSYIDPWYETHKKDIRYRLMPYTKDDLYTLYCLQEGVSRLKYKNVGRGSGTMNFLRSFMFLGSYGKNNPKYRSHLNIISGNTIVRCSHDVEPYKKENRYYLSLNTQKDMDKLPDSKYLSHTNEYFPGTFFEVKIYLNNKYFTEKLKDDKETA